MVDSSENVKTIKIDVVSDAEVEVKTGDEDEKMKVKRILLSGRVDDTSVGSVIRKIFETNEDEDAKRIELWIASHGGSIDMGIGLFDVIKMSPIPVDVVVTGCAMSMGATLLQAGAKRYATVDSTIMIHKAYGGGTGNPGEAAAQVGNYVKLARRNEKLVAKRVGMTYEEYVQFMGEARYMSAKQALKHNFIDAIKKSW